MSDFSEMLSVEPWGRGLMQGYRFAAAGDLFSALGSELMYFDITFTL